MWREYSSGYLKNNRAAAAAVMTAALISSLLLSLLGCLFYNMWKYEVERLRAAGDQYALMAMYLMRDANDEAPRLVFPLFLLIMGLAAFSLILIIHNAFAATMQARIHQFGILASIGATPRQIRACLLQETAYLCAAPVAAGTLAGIAGGRGLLGDKGEKCFAGGANAAISGDMLTTAGITVETDMALLKEMGYTVVKG